MDKQPVVYILASKANGTLYVGVTSNMGGRLWQHRQETTRGFTQQYHIHMLVWYELHGDMYNAIKREKQIKKWNRAWKIRLIETDNPHWRDLGEEL
jgi:putative endonuclease